MATSRTVTTTGYGTGRATPDLAVLQVAVTHRGMGVADAFGGANSAAELLRSIAREYVEPAKMSTSDVQIWQAYDNAGRQAGFDASYRFSLRCAELPVAGELLTRLTADIGDRLRLDGLGLQVSDPSEALASARATAFADALTRASQLAALSAGDLGEVVAVTEGGAHHSPAAGYRDVAGKAAAEMALEPGEQEISSSVTVTWQLVTS
ncbi:MAG: SIMPL domain-containing protein [Nocardioides sp.]